MPILDHLQPARDRAKPAGSAQICVIPAPGFNPSIGHADHGS